MDTLFGFTHSKVMTFAKKKRKRERKLNQTPRRIRLGLSTELSKEAKDLIVHEARVAWNRKKELFGSDISELLRTRIGNKKESARKEKEEKELLRLFRIWEEDLNLGTLEEVQVPEAEMVETGLDWTEVKRRGQGPSKVGNFILYYGIELDRYIC